MRARRSRPTPRSRWEITKGTAIGDIAVTDATGRVTHSAYCDVWRLREGKLDELRAFVVELSAEDGSEYV